MAKQRQIIKNLDVFKEMHPTFVTSILIKDFEYDEDPVEYGGDYEKLEECALRTCGHKHKKGFILKTRCGQYFNIGQHCGKTHLGANYKEWTEGVRAEFRAVSQRVRLAREPIDFLKEFNRQSGILKGMEKANHFLWDYLKPLAQEAARRQDERRFRGLSFLSNRLSLSSKLNEVEMELKELIQAAEKRETIAEEERRSLLNKLKVMKAKLRKMWLSVYDPCLAFFGSEVGAGEIERGTNLERIKAGFRSISAIPPIDVFQYPESIYIPSMQKMVNAKGVFKKTPKASL